MTQKERRALAEQAKRLVWDTMNAAGSVGWHKPAAPGCAREICEAIDRLASAAPAAQATEALRRRFAEYQRDERGRNAAEVVYWRQQYKQLAADALAAAPVQPTLRPPSVASDAIPGACDHSAILTPAYDHDAAATCSAGEVRRRWPRFDGVCPECGERVIKYASSAHCIMGDW